MCVRFWTITARKLRPGEKLEKIEKYKIDKKNFRNVTISDHYKWIFNSPLFLEIETFVYRTNLNFTDSCNGMPHSILLDKHGKTGIGKKLEKMPAKSASKLTGELWRLLV